MARHRVIIEFDLDDSGSRSQEDVAQEITNYLPDEISDDFGEDPDTGEGWGGFEGPFASNVVSYYKGVVNAE